jgi:hypothetical protein
VEKCVLSFFFLLLLGGWICEALSSHLVLL